MSNRGRQIVASFLIFELELDWRLGADHFESLLVDHDVFSNYGNWNAMAVLTGGRVNRFNMAKQSRDYDPDGAYIRHWIPELHSVPTPQIFEPYLMANEEQAKYGIIITETATADSNLTTSTYAWPVVVPQTFNPTPKSKRKAANRIKK